MLYAEFNAPFWGHQEDRDAERDVNVEDIHSSAHCSEQILDRKHFKEEGFILVDSSGAGRGIPQAWRGMVAETGGQLVLHVTLIAKKREMNVSVQGAVSHGLRPWDIATDS